jgi:hypothetical protein
MTKQFLLTLALALVASHAIAAQQFTQAQIDAAISGFNIEPDYKTMTGNQAWCFGLKSGIAYWKSLAEDGRAVHIEHLQRDMKTYTDMGCTAYDHKPIGEKL